MSSNPDDMLVVALCGVEVDPAAAGWTGVHVVVRPERPDLALLDLMGRLDLLQLDSPRRKLIRVLHPGLLAMHASGCSTEPIQELVDLVFEAREAFPAGGGVGIAGSGLRAWEPEGDGTWCIMAAPPGGEPVQLQACPDWEDAFSCWWRMVRLGVRAQGAPPVLVGPDGWDEFDAAHRPAKSGTNYTE